MPSNNLNAYNPQPYKEWMKRITGEAISRAKDRVRTEAELIARDLIENGPVYTGASSGKPQGLPIPKSHPAHGLVIGNFFTGGESGWQYREEETAREFVVIISNPMWHHYLKFVEAGFSASGKASKQAHFVLNAWVRHKQRMRK